MDAGEAKRSKRRDLSTSGEAGRSQSLHSTAAASAAESPGSKTGSREGRQEGGYAEATTRQESGCSAQWAKRRAETGPNGFLPTVKVSLWTKRMVSAPKTASKGASCLLRSGRAGRPIHGPSGGETLPMWKLPTGEPNAAKPHVRFGGRGGENLPDPYHATRIDGDIGAKLPMDCAFHNALIVSPNESGYDAGTDSACTKQRPRMDQTAIRRFLEKAFTKIIFSRLHTTVRCPPV